MNNRWVLFNASLFLIEAVFAIEVTASIIIAPNAVRSLGLNNELSGWIVNSYLYTAFLSMVILYALKRFIIRYISAARCFYIGIGIFVLGNVMCCIPAHAGFLFFGRITQGIGGALAMTSELWAACEYYRDKITVSLFWAECGSAIGVVIGPALGGFIASCGGESWRDLFSINAVIGTVTAICAWEAIRAEGRVKTAFSNEPFRINAWFMQLVLIQCAVVALAVGAEFLMSDYIQIKLNQSSRFVGFLAILASIGSILGSKWMAQYDHFFIKYARMALSGLVVAQITLAVFLFSGKILPSALPVFFIGICMGIANVAIYAEIAKKIEPVFFLPATLIYLMGMQIGSAIGVQTISLTESRGWSLFHTEIVMIVVSILPVLLAAIYAKVRLRNV
ncbi:MAG TPA: MFS transporter [Candidatus Omnitrophota bacterium]|nr:MFS transporter [Candidatus Omnitrophota bacterium]